MHFLKKTPLILLVTALAACDKAQPTEVRDSADTFTTRATWAATAAPVAPATVSGSLALQQNDGFRMNAALTVTGAPNATYQWRIYRGNCSVNAVQVTGQAPTGLLLFATTATYPDIVVNAAGTATLNRVIAGSLDSLTAYSVRVRLFAAAAWNGTNPIACGNLSRTAVK